MEVIVALIVQLVGGGIGGGAIGRLVKSVDLGTTGNIVVGAIGGVAGTWLATMIPGLAGIVGGGAAAGSLDIALLLGQGVAGLIGGGILTAIAGLLKNGMAKRA
jgi:hypothetical protein